MTTEIELNKYIGEKIKERRKELKMSQTKLGKYIKVSPQQLMKYEKGINKIRASTLHETAKALGVSISYFYKEGE